MEHFSSRYSSRDHSESNDEKNHFRNINDAPWITEQPNPATSFWHVKHQNHRRHLHENRHSYGSAPSGHHAHGFSHSEGGRGKRIAYRGRHEETAINRNCWRPIANQISEENYRYKRHDKQIGTSILGAYPGDKQNHSNHQNCFTERTSGGNYRHNAQKMGTFSCGPQHDGFSNYSNHRQYITGRKLEEKYRPYEQRGAYLHAAYHKDKGNYYNRQNFRTQTSRGNHRFHRLPGRQRERWHNSGNHAPYHPYHLPTSDSDNMIHGKDVQPVNVGYCKATVMVPTCSEDAASLAVSVQNITVVSDVNLSDDCVDKANASEFNTKDEKNGNKTDSKDSFLEGKESDLHVLKHVDEGDNEAGIDEASVCSDSATTSQQLGQNEPVAPSKSIFQARRKLLVLDLNGILVDIVRVPYADNVYANREHINVSRKTAFKRPFCDEFLNFCFNVFDIGIWSSRMKHNVDIVVDFLMGNMKNKLLFCWDNKKCTSTGFNTKEDAHKPLVLKELNKLWDKEDPDLPWEKSAYSAANTLLIDDSPYKALCNPPCTGIFPEPYRFSNEKDNSLGPEGDLRVFLEGLVKTDDVQEYVSKNPIGQHPIVNSNPSWKFYLQVIERVEQRKKVTV